MKKSVWLLVLVVLLAALQLPVLAGEPEPVWNLLDSSVGDDYTADWRVSGGSLGGTVTQGEGYVNITKSDDKTVTSATGGAYTWLVPQSLTLPSSGKFTVEATVRAAGGVTADKYGEISVRLGTGSNDTNGKLYPIFIKYGAEDGYIAPYSDGTKAYALNTTQWHNYGLVVDRESQTYSIYVDGAEVLKNIPATTYKGGNLLRVGVDNDARCNLDFQSARVGTGDLSANLSGAILFEEDFSNGDGAWTPNLEGAWSVQDGVYTQNQASGTLSYAGDEVWTNYSVEADVAAPSGSSGTVMLVGRATDTGRYYGAWANGKLSIQRRFNSSPSAKELTSMSFPMVYGSTHRWRIDFVGQTISLYIDGELKLEYTDTDNAFPNGRIGFGTNKTKGYFDNVVVRSLATPRAALSLETPADYQVVQRDVGTKSADVVLSGELNMTESATIKARVMDFDAQTDAAPIMNWTMVAENVCGEWTGTLKDVPQGGWYRIDLQACNAEGDVVAEATGESRWGVGINILCIGQSNMVGQGAAPYTVANDLAACYRWGQWKHLKDPYDGAGASIVPAMVNDLIAELGLPVAVVPAAYSGSGLHVPNTNHGAHQYWVYLNEENHFDTSTLYGRAITRAREAGGVELVVWNQGETDGALSVSKDDYKKDMQTLLSRLREDLDASNLPLFLCQIGTHAENISNNEAYTGIRSAQLELDDGVNFFLAATEMEFERKDTAHYKTPGLNEIGRRVANSMLYYYGKSTYYRGPSITSADYANDTRQVINVTIKHRGGTDITPADGITGFSVLDNTAEVAVTEAKRLNETTIQLTLAKPISGSGSLRYLYGLNPDVSNIVKDNTPLALPLENTTDALMIGHDTPVVVVWDIIDHAMDDPWNDEGFRSSTKTGTFTQGEGYVNINKGNSCSVGDARLYHWVVSPTGMALPRTGFTFQTVARVAGPVDGESNEIAVRMGADANDTNGKIASIFLGYGEDGFVSASATGTGRYVMELDTTQWHTYTMVVRPDGDGFVYDLYVDNTLAFEDVALSTYKGGDLLRFGADNSGRCNLDVQHVRVGSGEILPEGVSPAKLTGITLSAYSQKESESKTVTVTVTGRDFQDGDRVELALLDALYAPLNAITAEGTFQDNQAVIALQLPAGLPVNRCYVRASANGRTVYSDAYTITADRKAPEFPTFEPMGYTIELEDYKYNPTQEFNFPCVVDTKEHPVSNELGDYRYYLFYAPHDAPAGNCVAASNSLDGPWVEYNANPVVGKIWPKEDGSGNYYSVSHVSSPHVIWHDGIGKYVMYFHGENPTTRYATSDDLLHWTYGGVCVNANDFSPSGSGFSEASYARVYEHEVPGLGNKYIMLLMITGSGNSMHRNIYWAYSKDGFEWTPVQKSLLNPEIDPQYMNNFSGPYFMEWEVDGETRYFVICHASSGEIYAFEVGESLDEMIPWGIVYESKGQRYDSDRDDDAEWPDYGRAGAPCFIQDDDGIWHMFYEGGKRLHANIVHAVDVTRDQQLAAKVEALIDALPDLDDLTLEDADAVKAAREAYDGLTEAQKELVTNLNELEAAEARLEELKTSEPVQKPEVPHPVKPGSQPNADETWENPYTDVQESDWFYEAVSYVTKKGLMSGTGNGAFDPMVTTSRSMIVTILYRMEGEPAVKAGGSFTDVSAGAYYEKAVTWAASKSIVDGYGDGRFGSDDTITREQLAVIMYRYAAYMGYDVSASGELLRFSDHAQISSYAREAMSWANAEGLITGKGGGILDPQGNATRAEAAAILMRFCEKLNA